MLKRILNIDLGEIGRQTLKGSSYSYIGVLIGFLSTAVLFPRLLTPAQIGVTTLLITYSQFISILGNFGFGATITRLFPYFKNNSNGHNGIVFLSLMVLFVGFLFSSIVYYFLSPFIVSQDISNKLFFQFSWLVFPLSFFVLAFNLFDSYARALGNAVTGALIKEIVQRVLLLLAVLSYGFIPFIDFGKFIYLYVTAFSTSGIILIYYLIQKGQFDVTPKFSFLRKGLRKVIYSVSLYSILQGFGNILVQRVDTVMISFYLTLEETGIYGTTFFFGLLIVMPARALSRITSNVLAQAIKDKNMERVNSIYKKSSINQFLIGALVFIGIWGNIDNVFIILTEEFRGGEYVIFYIGLSNLMNAILGANAQILQLSRHYRYTAYLLVIFAVLVVATNFIFIPSFGIIGAAMASFISVLIYSLIRIYLVYNKFKLQPFSIKHVYIVLIALVSYSAVYFIPAFDNFIVDIIIRSSIISLVFAGIAIVVNVSDDFNAMYLQLRSKFSN